MKLGNNAEKFPTLTARYLLACPVHAPSFLPCWLHNSRTWSIVSAWPHHSSSAWSLASHRGGSGSRPGLVKWDLWWTKWRWGRFSSSTSVSLANLHATKFSILTITRGRYNRPEVGDVPSGPSMDSTPHYGGGGGLCRPVSPARGKAISASSMTHLSPHLLRLRTGQVLFSLTSYFVIYNYSLGTSSEHPD
jgi:hypothetical protein